MSDFLLKMLISAAEETIDMATHNEPQKPFEAETFTAPICTKALAGGSLGKYQRDKNETYDEVFQRWDRYNRIGPDKYIGGMRRPANYRITIEVSAHNPKPDAWGNWTVRARAVSFIKGDRALRNRSRSVSTCNAMSTSAGRATIGSNGGLCPATARSEPSLSKLGSTIRGVAGSAGRTAHGSGTMPGTSCSNNGIRRNTRRSTASRKSSRRRSLPYFSRKAISDRLCAYTATVSNPCPKSGRPKATPRFTEKGQLRMPTKKLFHAFAERAYRRPVALGEVDTFVELAQQLVADGNSKQDAMKGAYSAILCSPDFVYLRQNAGKLNDFALASRLSYFLWSSMPDDA